MGRGNVMGKALNLIGENKKKKKKTGMNKQEHQSRNELKP